MKVTSQMWSSTWRTVAGYLHAERLVRPLAAVAGLEGIEAGLLLEHVADGGLRGLDPAMPDALVRRETVSGRTRSAIFFNDSARGSFTIRHCKR